MTPNDEAKRLREALEWSKYRVISGEVGKHPDDRHFEILKQAARERLEVMEGKKPQAKADPIRQAVAEFCGYSPDHKGDMKIPCKHSRLWRSDQERDEYQIIGRMVVQMLNNKAVREGI